jgi:hypothetical protein
LIGTTDVPTPSPGTAAPTKAAGDRVVIVLLAQPDLAYAEIVSTGGLRHHLIYSIDCLRVGKYDDSSRHN